jgi:Predicted membrane protein (DUF2142)
VNRADRLLLLAFAFANAILYSSLMPLWEGFDEPWHYAYAHSLGVTRQLPVLRQTRVSQEVWDSVLSCPVSHVVARAWPELQTFDRYFALTQAERADERRRLEAIPHAEQFRDSLHANYEDQQPPLAYLVLALPDRALSHAGIPVRILWLRIFGAALSLLITYFAAESLFRTIDLAPPYRQLALFCIFGCQMYWATVAHVANDAVGLALSVWFLAAAAAFAKDPTRRGAIRLALALALGLLTKAYFLPLALLAAGLVAYHRRRELPLFAAVAAVLAGPWYVRNLVLYHNLSGLRMSENGVAPSDLLTSLGRVDWVRTIPYMLRATLWTGNNSFTSFSAVTLNCLLALLAVGAVLYAAQAVRRRPASSEWSVLGFLAVYGIAVILVVGNDVVFLHGASAGAAPWYTELLLTPALTIVFLGLSRSRAGKGVSIAVLIAWIYICAATYLVKLIPLYGGYTKGKMTLKDTIEWYRTSDVSNVLSTISLAPPFLIYLETGVVIALAVVIAARIVAHLTAFTKS